MDDIYQAQILDHYRHPRNFGVVSKKTDQGSSCRGHGTNAGCGDELEAEVTIKAGVIKEVVWQGTGCALSIASMSMLSEWVKGKKLNAVKKLKTQDVLSLLGLDETALNREKCITLPLKVFGKIK